MALFGRERVRPRTPDQIRAMRVAGLLTGRTLEMLRGEVRAGVTTGQLDALAEDGAEIGRGLARYDAEDAARLVDFAAQAAAIDDATVVRLGTGHWPQFSAPAALARALVEAFAEVAPREDAPA